jgi:hypothetical protein
MAEVVVISGSTVGVGRAVARRFARKGARIAILAGNDEAKEHRSRGHPQTFRTTATELVELGAEAAFAIPCNVDDDDQVTAAAARIEQELGPIDVWVDVEDHELPIAHPSRKWIAIAASAIALVGIGLIITRGPMARRLADTGRRIRCAL